MGVVVIEHKATMFFLFFVLLNVLLVSAGRRLDETPKVRGVNLGGWLVVEGWTKPSLFDGIENKDLLDGTKIQLKSTSLGKYVSAENGGGQNVVVDRDDASTWETFRVIVDLHAAPGSQNGMEHSASRDGSSDWANSSAYISRSLEVIDFLASRYGNNSALLGIELLNEPLVTTVPVDVLDAYYANGHQIVQKYTSTAYVIFCQRIGNADPHELYQINDAFSRIVVDVHYYNLFDSYYDNKTPQENIDIILKARQSQVEALNSANGPLVFVGEWTNEWKAQGASKEDYQRFGDAQLQAYGKATFGWSYWTLKNAEKHWDFEWNIKNHYLTSGRSEMISNNIFLRGCVLLFVGAYIL